MVHHSVFYEQRLSHLFYTQQKRVYSENRHAFVIVLFLSTHQDMKKPTKGSILSLNQSYFNRNY